MTSPDHLGIVFIIIGLVTIWEKPSGGQADVDVSCLFCHYVDRHSELTST